MPHGMKYLVRTPKELVPGYVIVHNHFRHTPRTPPRNSGGFRVWIERPGVERRELCDCGWSGLPHYRTAQSPAH